MSFIRRTQELCCFNPLPNSEARYLILIYLFDRWKASSGPKKIIYA